MTTNPIFFTRAGDDGTTTIYGQKERLPKYALRPEAYGIIDEAQAILGIIRANNCQLKTQSLLVRIERDLYLMMGQLAVADDVKLPSKAVDQSDIDWLESAIEEVTDDTGGFSDFVLPGDTLPGAQVHFGRTVIRRAERAVARLYNEEGLSNIYILRYLNRLSSLLFVLALYEDHHGGVSSPTYAKNVRD